MDKENIAKGIGWIFLVLLFLLPVLIGRQSENVWVGLLVFAGILLAWTGTAIYFAHETLAGYLIPAFLSLLSLSASIWLSRMAGGWWWAGVWLVVALAHYGTAIDAWQEEDSHMRVALMLGILSTAAAFLSPWLLPPILQGGGTISLSPTTFWIGLLVLLAFLALGVAWYQGYRESEEKRFIGWSLLGIGLLAGATYLSRLEGGWWWAVLWALAALLIGHAAYDLRQYSFGRVAGNLGIVLAILCLAIGVGGPYLAGRGWLLTAGPSQPAPSVPAATPTVTAPVVATATPPAQPPVAEQPTTRLNLDGAAGLKAVQAFLPAVVKSVWGIFHLFTLFVLGYLWLRSGWGGLSLILLLLVTIGFAGAVNSTLDETLTFLFSSSPASWMKEFLLFSAQKWGSMVPAIGLTALLASVAIIPALRFSSKVNRALRLHTGSELTLSVIERMQTALTASGIRPLESLFSGYIVLVILAGLWIALWVALRRIAALGGLPIGFLGIPDLTIPHWKPVWDLRYYSLGLVLWLFTLALQRVQQKYDPLLPLYQGCLSGPVLFISALVTVSLVPAGVTLFYIAVIASQILLFPARVIGIPEPKPPKPAPVPKRPPSPELQLIPIEELIQQQFVSAEPQPPPLAGSLLWESPAPLAAMMEWGGVRWLLREDGDLVRFTDTPQKHTLLITRGQAIYGLKEGDNQILVIGNGNRVLWLNAQSLEVVKEVTLSQPADMATLNPYKTMLAWVNVSEGRAMALSLKTGEEFDLLSGLNLATAMAFSADGRYLALGGADGVIHLFDFATRKVVATLAPPEASQGQAVRSLFGRKGGGWVSVYADRRVVLWNAERQVEKSMRPQRRIMALDFHPETGRLALGLSDGILQVFDADLNKVFDQPVQKKEISHVCFSQNGRSVFTIGGKTVVRRVDL